MNRRRRLACTFALGLLLAPAAAQAATHRVKAGGSIADAIEEARPGDVIEVEPGVYHEALTVDTPNLTLRGLVRGADRPVLDGRGKLNDGVIVSGSPFSMTGFGVRRYKGNGVTTQGVDGVVLSDLVVDDTGRYGVYPVQSRNVSVTHCTVTGISDAAIYVGESNHALVAFNEVHGNVAGIEIENTNDAEVRDNLAYDNTAGILVFVLPAKMQKHGRRNVVHRNWVVRNDRANFGDPNAIVGSLPHGLGIMVMGADETRVHDNWVKDNGSVGILVIRLGPEHAQKDPEMEPLPDGTRIGFNYVAGNGQRPHPFIAGQFQGRGGDLAWDGTGERNCADLSDAAVAVGAPLPACASAPAGPQASVETHAGHAGGAMPPPAPAALPEGAAVVRIRGMRFEPHHLTVKRGVPVAWVNDDAVTHTVTSGKGTQPTASPLASPFLLRGGVYSFTFAQPGVYEYLCLPHLDQAPMRGATVTVTE
jgi:parallel beta-helix repeat protein